MRNMRNGKKYLILVLLPDVDISFEVGLIFIISLHKFLVEKYVKIHKIDQCYLL